VGVCGGGFDGWGGGGVGWCFLWGWGGWGVVGVILWLVGVWWLGVGGGGVLWFGGVSFWGGYFVLGGVLCFGVRGGGGFGCVLVFLGCVGWWGGCVGFGVVGGCYCCGFGVCACFLGYYGALQRRHLARYDPVFTREGAHFTVRT